MTLPPMDSLQAMLRSAELGSLSAAAEDLALTHGAVSRRIKGLEAWLGQPLFERHGRGVRLTAAGEVFTRRVQRSLDAIEAAANDLRISGGRGAVRLSALPSVGRLWVLPRLKALQGEPADLAIALGCEYRMAVLESREADLAIRVGAGEWSGVEVRLLFSERSYPVAAPGLARTLEGTAPAEMLRQPLIHDSDSEGWRRWFRSVGVHYRPAGGEHRFVDYDIALAAAQSGLGVALSRSPLSDAAEASGAVVRLRQEEIERDRGHYLVMRSGETRPAVLRLADRIITLASTTPAAP